MGKKKQQKKKHRRDAGQKLELWCAAQAQLHIYMSSEEPYSVSNDSDDPLS